MKEEVKINFEGLEDINNILDEAQKKITELRLLIDKLSSAKVSFTVKDIPALDQSEQEPGQNGINDLFNAVPFEFESWFQSWLQRRNTQHIL